MKTPYSSQPAPPTPPEACCPRAHSVVSGWHLTWASAPAGPGLGTCSTRLRVVLEGDLQTPDQPVTWPIHSAQNLAPICLLFANCTAALPVPASTLSSWALARPLTQGPCGHAGLLLSDYPHPVSESCFVCFLNVSLIILLCLNSFICIVFP